jgi:hypothetical protein
MSVVAPKATRIMRRSECSDGQKADISSIEISRAELR